VTGLFYLAISARSSNQNSLARFFSRAQAAPRPQPGPRPGIRPHALSRLGQFWPERSWPLIQIERWSAQLGASKARPAAPPETLDHFSACFLSQCRERQRRWRPRRTPAAVAVPRLLPPVSLSLSPFSPFFLCLHRPRTSSSEEDGDGAAVKFLAGARARPWLSTPPSSSLATVPCWPDLGELSPRPAVLFPFLFPPTRRRVRRQGEPSHPLPLLSPFGFFDSDFALFLD